jgi:hypothetical protein
MADIGRHFSPSRHVNYTSAKDRCGSRRETKRETSRDKRGRPVRQISQIIKLEPSEATTFSTRERASAIKNHRHGNVTLPFEKRRSERIGESANHPRRIKKRSIVAAI